MQQNIPGQRTEDGDIRINAQRTDQLSLAVSHRYIRRDIIPIFGVLDQRRAGILSGKHSLDCGSRHIRIFINRRSQRIALGSAVNHQERLIRFINLHKVYITGADRLPELVQFSPQRPVQVRLLRVGQKIAEASGIRLRSIMAGNIHIVAADRPFYR
ncbi:hypothetical protein D3C73_1129020 [compost metagenome]